MEEGRDEKGRFAKGNLFSVGLQNNGRPPAYNDPNDMAQKIAEYLDYEDTFKRPDTYSKQGKGLYTIEGCALFLGFASVTSMYDYEKKSTDFMYILNRFRLFLQHWNAQKLYYMGTYAGSQFWLKNWGGYKDESTQHQKQEVTQVTITEKKRDE